MSKQGHTIRLTNNQLRKLKTVLSTFYESASKRDVLPQQFILLLKSVSDTVDLGHSLQQYELDVITWVIEQYLEAMPESEVDIYLEQLYHKIKGFWFEGRVPYFEKINPPKNYDSE